MLICNYIDMHVCIDEYSCVCIFQLRKSLHTIFIIIILTILALSAFTVFSSGSLLSTLPDLTQVPYINPVKQFLLLPPLYR